MHARWERRISTQEVHGVTHQRTVSGMISGAISSAISGAISSAISGAISGVLWLVEQPSGAGRDESGGVELA